MLRLGERGGFLAHTGLDAHEGEYYLAAAYRCDSKSKPWRYRLISRSRFFRVPGDEPWHAVSIIDLGEMCGDLPIRRPFMALAYLAAPVYRVALAAVL
jgi:hypothetical protein